MSSSYVQCPQCQLPVLGGERLEKLGEFGCVGLFLHADLEWRMYLVEKYSIFETPKQSLNNHLYIIFNSMQKSDFEFES